MYLKAKCFFKCISTDDKLHTIIRHIKQGREISSVYKDNAFVPGFVKYDVIVL